MKKVTIITPTVGSQELFKCIKSVSEQTYENVEHMIVVDGKEFWEKSKEIIETVDYNKLELYLPQNVGSGGWYGHRVYAATSYLINSDYVMFLDQDNWLDEDHVAKCVETLESHDYDWVFSLRSIHEPNGTFICNDNCESLGAWATWVSLIQGSPNSHIDTSCFFIKREVLVSVAGAWYGQYGQDRIFFHHLSKYYPNFSCTGYNTLNYRLGGNPGSVTKEFFLQGNEYMRNKYGNKFPWENDIS